MCLGPVILGSISYMFTHTEKQALTIHWIFQQSACLPHPSSDLRKQRVFLGRPRPEAGLARGDKQGQG